MQKRLLEAKSMCPCPHCHGDGVRMVRGQGYVKCAECRGSGSLTGRKAEAEIDRWLKEKGETAESQAAKVKAELEAIDRREGRVCREGANRDATKAQVEGTLKMLRALRAFLASDCTKMTWSYGVYLTKVEARRKLDMLLNVAINRRAGIPDREGRRQDSDYQRGLIQDQIDIQRHVRERVRIGYLRTDIARKRFGHLVERYSDY